MNRWTVPFQNCRRNKSTDKAMDTYRRRGESQSFRSDVGGCTELLLASSRAHDVKGAKQIRPCSTTLPYARIA